MSLDNISGNNKQFDLTKLKGGLQKKDLNGDALKTSIFDALDTDKNGVLDDNEISMFKEADIDNDGVLSEKEMKTVNEKLKKAVKENNDDQTVKSAKQKIKKDDLFQFLEAIGGNKKLSNVKTAVKDNEGNVIITYDDNSTNKILPDGKRINTVPSDNSISQPEMITVYEGETIISSSITNNAGTEQQTTEYTEYKDGKMILSVKKDANGNIKTKSEFNNDEVLYKHTTYTDDNNYTETYYDTNFPNDRKIQKTVQTSFSEGNWSVETINYENEKPVSRTFETNDKLIQYEYHNDKKRITYSQVNPYTIDQITYTYEYDESNEGTYSYTGTDIAQNNTTHFYHDGKTNKNYKVNYDGQGNTYVVVQDKESVEDICEKFGMTKEEFNALNGDITLDDSYVGYEILVKGELKANDDILTKRLSSTEAINAKIARLEKEEEARRKEELKAQKREQKAKEDQELRNRKPMQMKHKLANINSFRDLALYLYGREGATSITPRQLELRTNELYRLNPDIRTQKDWNKVRTINVTMNPEYLIPLEEDAKERTIEDTYYVDKKYTHKPNHWDYEDYGGDTAYEIAWDLYNAEDDFKPPFEMVAYRAKEIMDMNPDVFDKNGRIIKDGRIALKVKKTPDNRYYQARVKARAEQIRQREENQKIDFAQAFYDVADDNSGGNSIKKWYAEFINNGRLNKNNVVEFIQYYNAHITPKEGENVFDTILSEVGANVANILQMCKQIIDLLFDAAKDAGVNSGTLTTLQNRFNNIYRNQNTDDEKINQIANAIIGHIAAAQAPEAELTGNENQQAIDMQDETVTNARKTFDQNCDSYGWVAKAGDDICGLFGGTTRRDMNAYLGNEAEKIEKLRNSKTEAEFRTNFKNAFGVEYKPEYIAKYNKLQEMYTNIYSTQQALKDIQEVMKYGLRAMENWVLSSIPDDLDGKKVTDEQKKEALENIILSYLPKGANNPNDPITREYALKQYMTAQEQELNKFLNKCTNNGQYTLGKIEQQMEEIKETTFGNGALAEKVAKFHQGMMMTQMITGAIIDVIGTIALQFVPGLGALALANMARGIKWGINFVRGTKWVQRGVSLAKNTKAAQTCYNYATNTARALGTAARESRAGQTAGRVFNYTGKAYKAIKDSNYYKNAKQLATITQKYAQPGINTAITTGTRVYTDLRTTNLDPNSEEYRAKKEEGRRQIVMNTAFAFVGTASNWAAGKFAAKVGMESKFLTELTEEVFNVIGSAGVSVVAGDEYGSTDMAVDILTGLFIARLGHLAGKSEGDSITKEALEDATDLATAVLDALEEATDAAQARKLVGEIIESGVQAREASAPKSVQPTTPQGTTPPVTPQGTPPANPQGVPQPVTPQGTPPANPQGVPQPATPQGAVQNPPFEAPDNIPRWKKMIINGEEIEFLVTKDNIEFRTGRRMKESGEYEYFQFDGESDLMEMNGVTAHNRYSYERPINEGLMTKKEVMRAMNWDKNNRILISITRADGNVDVDVLNAALELQHMGVPDRTIENILYTCTGHPDMHYIGDKYNAKIYNKFKALLELAPTNKNDANTFMQDVQLLATMAHTGSGANAIYDDDIFELGKLFILTSDSTKYIPSIQKFGGTIRFNELGDWDYAWFKRVKEYMIASVEKDFPRARYYSNEELFSKYMIKVKRESVDIDVDTTPSANNLPHATNQTNTGTQSSYQTGDRAQSSNDASAGNNVNAHPNLTGNSTPTNQNGSYSQYSNGTASTNQTPVNTPPSGSTPTPSNQGAAGNTTPNNTPDASTHLNTPDNTPPASHVQNNHDVTSNDTPTVRKKPEVTVQEAPDNVAHANDFGKHVQEAQTKMKEAVNNVENEQLRTLLQNALTAEGGLDFNKLSSEERRRLNNILINDMLKNRKTEGNIGKGDYTRKNLNDEDINRFIEMCNGSTENLLVLHDIIFANYANNSITKLSLSNLLPSGNNINEFQIDALFKFLNNDFEHITPRNLNLIIENFSSGYYKNIKGTLQAMGIDADSTLKKAIEYKYKYKPQKREGAYEAGNRTNVSKENKKDFLNKIMSNKSNDEAKLKTATINDIVEHIKKGIPEFGNLDIKTQQNIAKILQNAMNTDAYKRLDNLSKTMLKHAILLKNIDNIDIQAAILKDLNVPDHIAKRVRNIVNCNDELLLAAYLANGNDLEVYKLFITEYQKVDNSIKVPDFNELEKHVKYARENANPVYTDDVNRKNIPTINVNGYDVQYFDLTTATPEQLKAIFGTDDPRVIVHMIHNSNSNFNITDDYINLYNITGNPNGSGGSLSATYTALSGENINIYSGYAGVILKGSELQSIPLANNENIVSGFKKSDSDYSRILLEPENIEAYKHQKNYRQARTKIRNEVIKNLSDMNINLTVEQYGRLIKSIDRNGPIPDKITIDGIEIPKDKLIRAIKKADDTLFPQGDSHYNEVVVQDPKIIGLVIRGDEINPSTLIFASQKNIPIFKM